ncbi:unnamed protein product [Prorocentrum cordatum]|uniref:Uncharacterized protein n=1 Tax=Prorocentrum cordatum TaxID=2364126 RepID=A0ABN9SX88_9DINO|nr:unnamed protein product [Polarella glacialis]
MRRSCPCQSVTQLAVRLGLRRGPGRRPTMVAAVRNGTAGGRHGAAIGIGTVAGSASIMPTSSIICAAVPSPTSSASASPTAAGAIAATGDPHLQNIYGERFDVMKPGRHVLIHIPRGEPDKSTLLRVEAEARRLGGQCSDMYFQSLNVTGAWAEAKQTGGLHYASQSAVNATAEWDRFGLIELKIVHGRTQQGIPYLNFYVRHLGRAGSAVGGLLGADDHSDAEAVPEACVQRLSLLAQSADLHAQGSAASVAVGEL